MADVKTTRSQLTPIVYLWHYRDFGPSQSSAILKTIKHNVSKTGSIFVLRLNGEELTLQGSLVVEVKNPAECLPLSEGGNRFSFRNIVFSNFQNSGPVDKVQKCSNSECYA
jgi:hypothetical protein